MKTQQHSQPYTSEYGKLDYNLLVLDYAQAIGKQLLHLPREVVNAALNENSGCTHADIIQSYCEAVEHFEGLLSPYHTREYNEEIDALNTEAQAEDSECTEFDYSKEKFAALMRLCDQKGFLLGKVAGKTQLGDDDDGQK